MESKKRPHFGAKEVKEYLIALGFVLNYCRTRLGLTVKKVARRARIEPERLDAIEAGTDETIDLKLILDLASALNVDPGAVMKIAEHYVRKSRDKSRRGSVTQNLRKRAPLPSKKK
jgi:transcriptional regulator with XRE-family HTH domain